MPTQAWLGEEGLDRARGSKWGEEPAVRAENSGAGIGRGKVAGLSVHLTCSCNPPQPGGPALGAGMVRWNSLLSSLRH